jgi:hypothetical protein
LLTIVTFLTLAASSSTVSRESLFTAGRRPAFSSAKLLSVLNDSLPPRLVVVVVVVVVIMVSVLVVVVVEGKEEQGRVVSRRRLDGIGWGGGCGATSLGGPSDDRLSRKGLLDRLMRARGDWPR